MPTMPITLSKNSYANLKIQESSTIMSLTSAISNEKRETATACVIQETNTATTTTTRITYKTQQHVSPTVAASLLTPPIAPTPASVTTTTVLSNNVPVASGSSVRRASSIKRSSNDFRFLKTIGEGSFSTVYLAEDIHTKKNYAIKVCDKSHIIREKKQEYIKREREVLHSLINTKGFVNLFCTFQDTKSLYFVMTYAKNGDLLPFINQVGAFDLAATRFYAAQLVVALEEMHKRGIVHRDLKPENILLDENLHIMVADFGSAKIFTSDEMAREQLLRMDNRLQPTNENEDDCGNRTRSFVGTAQYVSPEILKGLPTSRATDLWALGCIIYQMISGLPSFCAPTEYLIFQKILKLDLKFPDGFDKIAQDLVQKLLRYEPHMRIGSRDAGDIYTSIRLHPFFDGIDFDTILEQPPPEMLTKACQSMAGTSTQDHGGGGGNELEPGLGDKQLKRLITGEIGIKELIMEDDQDIEIAEEPKNIISIPESEILRRLEIQKLDKWNQFVEGELILKKGFVHKKKGLFARRRMFLLTTGPRLFYIDPVSMVKKGEIPWSKDLRVEAKSFKMFLVHTPKRTYYLEDPEGYALEWCDTIDQLRQYTNTYILAQLLFCSSALTALHQIREIVLMLLITIILRMKSKLQNQISSS